MSGYPGTSTSLVDILDRVLDKGLVVAGDIKISLANVELLTIKIRLLVCSIDKAEQIGLNWWRYDQSLTHPVEQVVLPAGAAEVQNVQASQAAQATQVAQLEARISQLEQQLAVERQGGQRPARDATPQRRGAGGSPARRQRRTTD